MCEKYEKNEITGGKTSVKEVLDQMIYFCIFKAADLARFATEGNQNHIRTGSTTHQVVFTVR